MKTVLNITFVIGTLVSGFFCLLDNPQILGIWLDIIGAYFIAQGFMTKKLRDIVCEAWGDTNEKYPGCFSENLAISLYEQTIDAWTGFIILSFGFIFQGIGTIYSGLFLPYYSGPLFVLIVLLVSNVIQRKLCFPAEKILDKFNNSKSDSI